jgi:hypothetical protein
MPRASQAYVDPVKSVNRDTQELPVDLVIKRLDEEMIYYPDFQRNYLLTKGRKLTVAKRMMESILVDAGLPSITLMVAPSGKQMVVDGLQRLESIKRFVNDEFPLAKNPQYDSLYEYRRKRFSELPVNVQNAFLTHRKILATVFDNQNEIDLWEKLFENLNSGSTVVNRQEVRRAVYGGELMDAIADLAGSERLAPFLLAKSNDRFAIDEAILRFFACYDFIQRKENLHPGDGGMSKVLDIFTEAHQKSNIANLAGLFNDTLELLWEVFDKTAFSYNHLLEDRQTKKGPVKRVAQFNKDVMTAQLIAFATLLPYKKAIIANQGRVKKTVERAITTKKYLLSMEQARTNHKNMIARNNLIYDAVKAAIR